MVVHSSHFNTIVHIFQVMIGGRVAKQFSPEKGKARFQVSEDEENDDDGKETTLGALLAKKGSDKFTFVSKTVKVCRIHLRFLDRYIRRHASLCEL